MSVQEEVPSEEKGKKGKVVLYVTSVQAIKETHELCKKVLHCLRARKVRFTMKDVFLHPNYGEELNERMGDCDKNIKLPQVRLLDDVSSVTIDDCVQSHVR